jgi:hypothetical protein
VPQAITHENRWPAQATADWRRRSPPGAGKRQGLDRRQLAELVARQGGLCALCRRPLGVNFVVDHDHQLARQHGHNPRTGCSRCVRGILHTACNTAIGTFEDDPERLLAAAHYVTRLRRTY